VSASAQLPLPHLTLKPTDRGPQVGLSNSYLRSPCHPSVDLRTKALKRPKQRDCTPRRENTLCSAPDAASVSRGVAPRAARLERGLHTTTACACSRPSSQAAYEHQTCASGGGPLRPRTVARANPQAVACGVALEWLASVQPLYLAAAQPHSLSQARGMSRVRRNAGRLLRSVRAPLNTVLMRLCEAVDCTLLAV